MKKLLSYVFGAVLAGALVLPALAAQPAAPEGPLKMALTGKPVMFDHAVHSARTCADCHHAVNGEENYQKCSTAGCHDIIDQKDRTVNSYYRVMHDRKITQFSSCLSCHFEVVTDLPDRKKDLTSCVGSLCHPKS